MPEETKDALIEPEVLADQVEQYVARRPVYVIYARTLRRLLEVACAGSVPEAVVQSRAKTVSSFAEKCVRKYRKYKDPVNQLTDLCGARVLVQTIDQVTSVERFIDTHFLVCEKDDKTRSLDEEAFGYRDLHFIASLPVDLCTALDIDLAELRDALSAAPASAHEASGIEPADPGAIVSLVTEIQVRTWLQHAWADVVHDRVYKGDLPVPPEVRRQVALQAALMEEGDRNFREMTSVLDRRRANYASFVDSDGLDREIGIQALLSRLEKDAGRKTDHALEIARMQRARGNYAEVVRVLDPLVQDPVADYGELFAELGHALCEESRDHPTSDGYARGLGLLRDALQAENRTWPFVVDQPKAKSRKARAHYRLARALDRVSGERPASREHYREAHEIEPRNPYFLAAMLHSEIGRTRGRAILLPMRGTIRAAIDRCRSHALAGIELPSAYFAAGRLGLLLDDTGGNESYEAFGHYARGIRHVLDGDHHAPGRLIEEEVRWIQDLGGGDALTPGAHWVLGMLALARRVLALPPKSETPDARRLIVAGGAATLDETLKDKARPLLRVALENFEGDSIISGGTISGVPGLVGEIEAELRHREARPRLVAYIPGSLPHDAPKDERYEEHIVCGGRGFSPDQLLRTWTDVLHSGVSPCEVMIIGIGGGPLSAAEYHLGLALGASVAVMRGSGGTADALAADELWRLPNLLPVPLDMASVSALLAVPGRTYSEEMLERLGRSVHAAFVANSADRLPEPMRPYDMLEETYRTASREQARYAVHTLETHGFGVREMESPRDPLVLDRSDPIVEKMAEAEHGRWNIERLRDGWRLGPRDDEAKMHPLLLPWEKLSAEVREWDIEAVINFPSILSEAGLEVFRR